MQNFDLVSRFENLDSVFDIDVHSSPDSGFCFTNETSHYMLRSWGQSAGSSMIRCPWSRED